MAPSAAFKWCVMMADTLQRIVLVGDAYGIPELLAHVPISRIAAIIGASVRPASHAALRAAAEPHGIPVLIQPRHTDAAYPDFIRAVAALRPDGIVCHSYAMLLRPELLALVEGRAYNLHMSLLPKNRGPNPVQWALIHGDNETGVTLHRMDEGFDTGPIVAQERITISDDDTWVTLLSRLKLSAASLLRHSLLPVINGDMQETVQPEASARSNARIPQESFAVDFSTMSDRAIFNLIRAQVAPLKGAYIDTAQGRVRFDTYVPPAQIQNLRSRYA